MITIAVLSSWPAPAGDVIGKQVRDKTQPLDLPRRPGFGEKSRSRFYLQQEHAISITVKAIFLADGLLIAFL